MERVADELWIGTYGQGLYVLNMMTNAVTHYGKGTGPTGLSGNDIFCLKKDRNGNVWIGNNGSGIDVFKPASGIIHHFDKTLLTVRDKLPLNGYIRTIEEDDRGNIWIGSNGTGIAVYDPFLKNFKKLDQANSNLPSNSVSAIYVDQKGIVWIGTDGGGLSKWDNSGKFISYSEADGLSNAVIHKILESGTGKLWVSTNKGISSFDEENRKFKNYSYQNGLQKSTFSLGAGIKTSNGDLFFWRP
ncbi:MAG: two-component regulator propeller domain-containing protein [Chitinophagaceae bacterium]